MPLQQRSRPNSWRVTTQGNPTWLCRIKHKWHYLNEKKLRACERCGQLQGRRNYLQWIIDEPIMQKAAKTLARNLGQLNGLEPIVYSPRPKQTPWHDREQFELANAPPPPVPPPMKELRDGVIPKRPSGYVYDLESRRYIPHGAGPGGAGRFTSLEGLFPPKFLRSRDDEPGGFTGLY